VLAQIAAEALQVPFGSISVSDPDTDLTPYDQQTSSSRTTFTMGGAIKKAAEDLALVLRSGALPAKAVYLEERTVGPSLGADSIRQGVTASIAGMEGQTGQLAYGSAKGALHTLTQALARDLAPTGVRVLAVAPGTIDTAFQREPGNVEIWKKWVGNIPLARIGRPEEIGEVVAFLATDAASFIVGETIHVNGGIFMS